ncbi:MAG: hypothetical protein A2571_03535 [Candidatus Vogelbacteria bacterium RIFOXYD1_FULL_44_32]|uniref:Uncharacterized protein n=1 Tax=Candidatus Vogelbacteria bacterium RIFOXYD1_FULL_44_32 TaxID=1802438 RepID=A0A1G2QBZ5_9BACT|nr:MAG: hypothetical protein A2571_03535 [Candidatus Vogelbacteria bacterium RIFOXYD1_FULL_44_32]
MVDAYIGHGMANEPVYDVTSLGKGLELVKRRKVEFDRKEAMKLLELDEFPGDRRLKQNHVDRLIKAMLRGTFHPEWVTLIVCALDGKHYRMNGQHTAWARIEMPEVWPCSVELLEYRAETDEDLRSLYSSIDRSSPRTRTNVMDSYLVGTPEFEGIKRQSLSRLPQGFELWFWPSAQDRRKHDADDTSFLLKTEQYDLAVKVAAFLDKLSARENRHMFRSPVIAAMFAIFNKSPQVAVKFWQPIADGTGIDKKGDPRLKLRNELMRTAVDSGGGSRSDKKRVSQEYMFRLCINAWNAYREERSLSQLKAYEGGKRCSLK